MPPAAAPARTQPRPIPAPVLMGTGNPGSMPPMAAGPGAMGTETGAGPATAGGPGGMPAKPQTSRDFELLGDLHFKQGQFGQAAEAYAKAWESARVIKVAEDLPHNEATARIEKARDAAKGLAQKLVKAYAAAGDLEAAGRPWTPPWPSGTKSTSRWPGRKSPGHPARSRPS